MSDPTTPAPAKKWPFPLPDRNVLAGGLSSLAAWAILAAVSTFLHFDLAAWLQPYVTLLASFFAINPPPSAQGGLAIVIGLAIAYFVPPSETQIIKRVNDRIIALARGSAVSPASPVEPPPVSVTTKS